jgi:hypothetical protein
MSTFWKATIDGREPCGLCGWARELHWGRRNGREAQKLRHQWRPVLTDAGDAAADEGYRHMLAHPEQVVDAQDLFE